MHSLVLLFLSDRPKIRMPRALRSRHVKHVGEQINLVIPFCVSSDFYTYIYVKQSCAYIVGSKMFHNSSFCRANLNL